MWEEIKQRLPIGTRLSGVVTEHRHFGFFVDIGESEAIGLVQITDIVDEGGMTPEQYPAVGATIEAVVLGHNDRSKQIWLGMRPSQLNPPPNQINKPTNLKYLFIFAAIAIAIPIGVMAWSTITKASRAAEESAQLALFTEAVGLLAEYHEQHGEYPDSLDKLALSYPDGGDKSTLASFTYNSDGANYVLTTHGVSTGQVLRECSGEAKALEAAKQWVKDEGLDLSAHEFSATPDGKGWSVLIEYQPPTPGSHTILQIDSLGKIIEVIPGR